MLCVSHINLRLSHERRAPFSVIVKERYQEYIIPYTPYMTNELCKFEEGQGCATVLSLVRKGIPGLLLETLCLFNGPRQTLY